jgi:hypothetical protein
MHRISPRLMASTASDNEPRLRTGDAIQYAGLRNKVREGEFSRGKDPSAFQGQKSGLNFSGPNVCAIYIQ